MMLFFTQENDSERWSRVAGRVLFRVNLGESRVNFYSPRRRTTRVLMIGNFGALRRAF